MHFAAGMNRTIFDSAFTHRTEHALSTPLRYFFAMMAGPRETVRSSHRAPAESVSRSGAFRMTLLAWAPLFSACGTSLHTIRNASTGTDLLAPVQTERAEDLRISVGPFVWTKAEIHHRYEWNAVWRVHLVGDVSITELVAAALQQREIDVVPTGSDPHFEVSGRISRLSKCDGPFEETLWLWVGWILQSATLSIVPMYFECTRHLLLELKVLDDRGGLVLRRSIPWEAEFRSLYGAPFFFNKTDEEPDHEEPIARAVSAEVLRVLAEIDDDLNLFR